MQDPVWHRSYRPRHGPERGSGVFGLTQHVAVLNRYAVSWVIAGWLGWQPERERLQGGDET